MSEFYRQKIAYDVEFIFGTDFGLNGDWTSQFVWEQKPPRETWVKVTSSDRSEKGKKRLQQLKEQAEDIEYEEVHC